MTNSILFIRYFYNLSVFHLLIHLFKIPRFVLYYFHAYTANIMFFECFSIIENQSKKVNNNCIFVTTF